MMADHRFSVSLFSSVCVLTVKSTMCVYFYMFLMMMWSSCSYTVTGQQQVMGSQTVLATVGDDVILPCHIEPPVNMERRTMEWLRPDLKPEFVLLLQDGRHKADSVNPLYKGRSSLFADELPHGNISLKLTRVKLSDEGKFKCFVPHLRSNSVIKLLVGSVSQPVISSNGPKDGGSSLTFDSGCWYPEPEMSWLDSNGTLLPAEPSVTETRPPHCYIVQRNVTVRGAAGHVTCRVHLPRFNHTVDKQHDISEGMLPSEGGSSGGVIAGIVIPVIIILVAAAAVLGYLYRENIQKVVLVYFQTGRSGDQKDVTTSPKPLTWNPTSQRWRQQYEELAYNDDCKVIRVGSFVLCCVGKQFSLGREGSTEVFLGLTDDGTEVAVKRIYRFYYRAHKKDLLGHLKLDHPSIVRYVDLAEDDFFGYITHHLCEYNLRDYMDENSLSEPQWKQLSHQVLQSLRFLHCQDPPILHRAIKHQNVLIDAAGNARLADFGLIPQPEQENSHGTWTRWVAKEKAMGEDCAYTKCSDIQVAGMLIYYILSGGHHPFGKNLICVANIGMGNYNLDRVQDEVAKHLIEWMINADPEKRPTVEECLDHPFFWSNDRRVEYLRRIGNQQEVVSCPDDDLIRALDQYAEQGQFNTWKHKFPPELLQKMDGLKSYPENSYGLLHFIHNLHEQYAEDAAHIDLMEMFPDLVGGVYKFAKEQDWNSRPALQEIIQREEVSTGSV